MNIDFTNKYYDAIEECGWQDFSKEFDLDLNSIKTLTLQTKVRRLSYIKMILNLFNKSNYYPDNVFNKKIEQEAAQLNNSLMQYTNSKGIIEVTKTGRSSEPYIEAMISLKLLYTQNNKYQLSKYGKIFNVLNNRLEKSNDNYFDLSKFEKSFFLFFILQNDNLYFLALIDLIYIQNNKTKIKNIKEIFQDYILNQLEFTTKYSEITNQDKLKISTQIKRIKSWKNPQIYLEHIIEPRINWLLDLNMLEKDEFQQNYIVLSKEGLAFFNVVNSYFDIFQEKYTLIDQFECIDFFNLVSDIYYMNAVKITENDIVLMENYIDESFNLFKTIAPNRVTASQAILYTCFMMLFKENKVVNFCTIQHHLKSNKNTNFIFDWYKTDNDGSIRKKGNYMTLENLGLISNPFRLTPPLNPDDIKWAGMVQVKNNLEKRIKMAMKMEPSRIVINWGAYGSGKTHAALYFSKTKRLEELSTELDLSKAKSFKVTLPRTSNNIVQEFLRSFLGQYSLESIREDFQKLIDLVEEEKVRTLIDIFSDDAVVKSVILGIAFDDDDDDIFDVLKKYIFGDKTKGTLEYLELPYGLENDEQIANLLGAIISCLTYEKKLYSSIIIWLDEFEDIDTIKKNLADRFTTFLRQFIDKTPNNFLLFVNFTQKAFLYSEDLSMYLGEALASRAKHMIDYTPPTLEEALEYVKDLCSFYLKDSVTQCPFDSNETILYVIGNIGNLTARKINETFSIILEMATIEEKNCINKEFIDNIKDEIIAWDEKLI